MCIPVCRIGSALFSPDPRNCPHLVRTERINSSLPSFRSHEVFFIRYDNANMMCSNYPSGVSKTSNPQPGDLWVTNSGTYGHVAVITAVHSSTVDVIEQNSSPSGKNSYSISSASCFLTAGHSSGSCPHVGYYCGVPPDPCFSNRRHVVVAKSNPPLFPAPSLNFIL